MKNLKLLIGFISLFLIYFVSTSSKSTIEVNEEYAFSEPVNNLIDEKQQQLQRLHRLRQKRLLEALSVYFEKAIHNGDIVGAGVSVVHSDSILISTGFGKRSFNKETEVDGETVFRLGSLSKGFAGVLAASLETEGEIRFDDRVTDYLPEFKLGDKSNTDKVEIAHILSHSTGVPYHSYTNLVELNLDMSKILGKLSRLKPQNPPNQQYSYQNAMFALSQEVFLKATGDEVKVSLKNRFFTPLEMTNISMTHVDLLNENNVALPHRKQKNVWRNIPLRNKYYNAVTAGGINASSSDMAKWMRFLLGGNPEVMPFSDIKKAFQPRIKIDFNNKYYQRWPGHVESHYGLGWRIHKYSESDNSKDKTIWHHGGTVNNYRNEIALFPDDEIGICVLLNGNSRFVKNLIPDLHALVKANLE